MSSQKSFWFSPTYSIIKFEFLTVRCDTPRSQHVRLSEHPLCMHYIRGGWLDVFTHKSFLPDCLFKSNSRTAKFSILAPLCAFWLRVWMLPRSLTLRCHSHRGVKKNRLLYLGKIKYKFEKMLNCLSWAKMGSNHEKN